MILNILLAIVFGCFAFAYTYTCQEGGFTIDVPDGWGIKTDNKSFSTGYTRSDYSPALYISWDVSGYPKSIPDARSYELRITRHNQVSEDKLLTKNELSKMNIDAGFVLIMKNFEDSENWIIFCASFQKRTRFYKIDFLCPDTPEYKTQKETIIKTLNSFRALD